MNIKFPMLLICIYAFFVSISSYAQDDQDEDLKLLDSIVAVVNDDVIALSELKKELVFVKLQLQQRTQI